MSNPSLWRETSLPTYPPLQTDGRFDVVVVGAGIAGLTAAYLLKEAGLSVCVLEREQIGAVETGNTTAHVTYVTDERLTALARNFDEHSASLAWMGGQAAIRAIESIVQRIGCSCGFQRVANHLHLPIRCVQADRTFRRSVEELQDEAELARKLGFDATYLDTVPGIGMPGVRFADQALFHPLEYLSGLAQAIEGNGCEIHERSGVTETESEPLAVRANGCRIECSHLAIMTHVPLAGNLGMAAATLFQSKLAAYTSYVVCGRTAARRHAPALYSDTDSPYRYLRVVPGTGFDRLILGGEDHKTGQADDADDRYRRLESALFELAPDAILTHRWCGQVIETADGLPYIGETAPGQFVATGFGGNGMTWGTLAAMMACDWAMDRANPWQDLLSTKRAHVRGAALGYVKENLDYPYYLVKGKLTPAEGKSLGDLAPGEGKILTLHGEKAACCRDDDGTVHAVSPACTHMGCDVHWNSEERTWDCPCHGSRFHPDGQVMTGPAESPLEGVTTNEKSQV